MPRQIGKWFHDAFDNLSKAPRYLIPCYFDAIVTGVYNIAEEVFWNKMSSYVCLLTLHSALFSGFPRLLESPGFFLENSRTWKVLEIKA